MQLIDHLSDTLTRSWRIPFSALSVVNATELSQLLERLRITVPSAIMEGERTLSERDHILADAHREAERIIQDARQRATELLSDQAIVIAAQDEAHRIIEEGRAAAHRRAEEADRYATQVLEELAQTLQSITNQVDNGVQVMRNKRLTSPLSDPDGALPLPAKAER